VLGCPARDFPRREAAGEVWQGCLYGLLLYRRDLRVNRKGKKVMWTAFKNVESGMVHAVSMPSGMSPHGFAMDWPLVETDEAVSCHTCLQFAFRGRNHNSRLRAMLPDVLRGEERACGICGAPVSRCCC